MKGVAGWRDEQEVECDRNVRAMCFQSIGIASPTYTTAR